MRGSCVRVASVGQIIVLYISKIIYFYCEIMMIQINYLRNRQYNIQKREIDIKAKVDYSNNLGVQDVIEDPGWTLQQLSSPYKNLAARRLSPQSYKLQKGQLVAHRFKSDNADKKQHIRLSVRTQDFHSWKSSSILLCATHFYKSVLQFS